MRQLFRKSLFRKFALSIRDEGVGSALRKTRNYAVMRLRGIAPSVLIGAGEGKVRNNKDYLSGIWRTLAREGGFHVETPPATLSQSRRIALIGDLNLPQCRKYRIEQLATFWEAQGVALDYAHYEDIPRCVELLQNATHLMEYRLLASPITSMYRYEARRLRLPVLYDLDDPLFSIAAYETYENMKAVEPALKAHFVAEAPRYLDMMNGADVITVSTPGMAEHTRLLTGRPVYVRRNFADAATLRDGAAAIESKPADDGLFRVCFASGSRGHEVDFAFIAEQVRRFLAGGENRRLMIVGHFDLRQLPEELQDRVEAHPFVDYDGYLRTLSRANVAVMPLTDDLFNRCKSAVRVIDASSVAVPSIVGTVGDLANMVRDGETGLVAQTPEAWLSALETLANNPDKTRHMGQAARHDLETRWIGAVAQPGPHIVDHDVLEWVLS